jgi:hypothetical protein
MFVSLYTMSIRPIGRLSNDVLNGQIEGVVLKASHRFCEATAGFAPFCERCLVEPSGIEPLTS